MELIPRKLFHLSAALIQSIKQRLRWQNQRNSIREVFTRQGDQIFGKNTYFKTHKIHSKMISMTARCYRDKVELGITGIKVTGSFTARTRCILAILSNHLDSTTKWLHYCQHVCNTHMRTQYRRNSCSIYEYVLRYFSFMKNWLLPASTSMIQSKQKKNQENS